MGNNCCQRYDEDETVIDPITVTSKPGHDVEALADMDLSIPLQVKDQVTSGKAATRGKSACILIGILLIISAGIAALKVYIGPAIVKSAMARSQLTMNTVGISSGKSSLLVSMEFSISNDASLGCDISAMEVGMMYKDKEFGTLRLPTLSLGASQVTNYSVQDQELTVTDGDVWGNVTQAMMRSIQIIWRLKAYPSITAKVKSFPIITFTEVPFDKEIEIMGFNGFVDPATGSSQITVRGLDVIGGQNGSLDMVSDIDITNPSNVAVSIGPISLQLWTAGDNEVQIAEVMLDNFAMQANQQRTAITRFSQVRIIYTPPSGTALNEASGRGVLSTFVMGNPQNIVIRGSQDGSGTNDSRWKPAIASLTTLTSLPGLVQNRLVLRSWMKLPSIFDPMHVPSQMLVRNPFSADLRLKGSGANVFLCKKFLDKNRTKCGEYNDDSTGFFTEDALNDLIPGKQQKKLKWHSVTLATLLSTSALSALSGSLIRFKGNMTMAIGDTPLTIEYEEDGVPIGME